MTVPIDAARQALNDTEAALARLRPALAAAYGIAGENLTKAAGQLDKAERAQAAAEGRAQRAEADMVKIAEAYDRHRRTLAAIFARSADTPFEEITEYAARTLNRSGRRLLAGKARADRFEAAWHSARSRARAHLGEQQRIRGWLTHWADRARVAETDAERFHAAWHSARDRAQRTASELRVTQASRRRWKRRARAAEQALSALRPCPNRQQK
ncbi:hypothetical protein ACG93S_28870 [Streptomyces sp. WAC01490]|uniref:hypothetical protein n=1 Tax=unclassified Streptomyces TaxID=2593676 RepID=UPI003F38A0A9